MMKTLHSLTTGHCCLQWQLYFVEVYLYTLENCSGTMTNIEKKREEKMYREVHNTTSSCVIMFVPLEYNALFLQCILLEGKMIGM